MLREFVLALKEEAEIPEKEAKEAHKKAWEGKDVPYICIARGAPSMEYSSMDDGTPAFH